MVWQGFSTEQSTFDWFPEIFSFFICFFRCGFCWVFFNFAFFYLSCSL